MMDYRNSQNAVQQNAVKTRAIKLWVTIDQHQKMIHWQKQAGYPSLASYVRAAALRSGPLLARELSIPDSTESPEKTHEALTVQLKTGRVSEKQPTEKELREHSDNAFTETPKKNDSESQTEQNEKHREELEPAFARLLKECIKEARRELLREEKNAQKLQSPSK